MTSPCSLPVGFSEMPATALVLTCSDYCNINYHSIPGPNYRSMSGVRERADHSLFRYGLDALSKAPPQGMTVAYPL